MSAGSSAVMDRRYSLGLLHFHPVAGFELVEQLAYDDCFVSHETSGDEHIRSHFLRNRNRLDLNLSVRDDENGLAGLAIQNGSLRYDVQLAFFGLRTLDGLFVLEESDASIHFRPDIFVGLYKFD